MSDKDTMTMINDPLEKLALIKHNKHSMTSEFSDKQNHLTLPTLYESPSSNLRKCIFRFFFFFFRIEIDLKIKEENLLTEKSFFSDMNTYELKI